jgi:DNA-binding NtrC family response regulator
MEYSQHWAVALGHRPAVLIVEDDAELADSLQLYLDEEGWDVETAYSFGEAREKLMLGVFDLVIADYYLPDQNVLPLFEEIRRRSPVTKVLVMTGAREKPETAIYAFREGAADFVYKPFTLEQLEERIALLIDGQKAERHESKPAQPRPVKSAEIIGESPGIKKLFEVIGKVADSDLTVLITGETGTGKELVARALHEFSRRRKPAFVAINCAAVPETLLEDELFGHAPGAYTDAKGFRKGRFEEAQGGTLFLDEIGDMPLSIQAKLLRVLEDRKVRKLGSNATVEVDTRVVAATNCDLWNSVQEGRFRRDLYFRLRMIQLDLPSLRERRSDIPLLATHFLRQVAQKFNLSEKKLDSEALRLLMAHDWPGNVRELKSLLEVATLLAGEREVLQACDFDLKTESSGEVTQPGSCRVALPEDGLDLNSLLTELEQDLISQSLERTGGNKKEAAKLLSLKRTTLVAKLRRKGFSEEREVPAAS